MLGRSRKRFRGFKAQNGNTDVECTNQIEIFQNTFYVELANELKKDADLEPNVDCLVSQLKDAKFAEFEMKKLVLTSSKKMSKRKRKKALKAIDYSLEKSMENALKLCTSVEAFGELFDELYSYKNDNETESEQYQEDYCLRVYIVENNFINTTVYNINVNPHNISVSELNCNELVKSSKDEVEEEFREEFVGEWNRPSKRVIKCIKKSILTGNFFENTLRVVMLGEIKIDDDLKTDERNMFIKNMRKLYEKILKC